MQEENNSENSKLLSLPDILPRAYLNINKLQHCFCTLRWKFTQAIPLNFTGLSKLRRILKHHMASHGICDRLIADKVLQSYSRSNTQPDHRLAEQWKNWNCLQNCQKLDEKSYRCNSNLYRALLDWRNKTCEGIRGSPAQSTCRHFVASAHIKILSGPFCEHDFSQLA